MADQADLGHTAETLAHRWRDEHVRLNVFFDEFRQWAYDPSQHRSPHFGQTAGRLRQLRQQLVEHFQHEDELVQQIADSQGGVTPEVDANRRQIATDHRNLLHRLDGLIDMLGSLNPPFRSWQEAVAKIEAFANALEQHEEQEADSITWLLPHHEASRS